jgi:hypothetical protein
MTSKNRIIPPKQSSFVDCGEAIKEEDIKEEINEEESVDDPLTIQQEIDRIDIEEFKIEPGHANINDITNEDKSDRDNVNEGNNLNVNNMDEEVIDNIEENENVVEGNDAAEGNINYEALQNLSVVEALAFFSS